MKKFALTLLSCGMLVCSFAAQVGEVRFEQSGADRLTEAQLALNIRLHKGAEYRREILDGDVKRLYLTGNFADPADKEYWESKLAELERKEANAKENERYFRANKVYDR